MGSISFGIALVAGKNRVPYPAAGNRHFLITDITQSFRKWYFCEFEKAVSLAENRESTSSLDYRDSFSDSITAIFETDDIILAKIVANLNLNDFDWLITGIG